MDKGINVEMERDKKAVYSTINSLKIGGIITAGWPLETPDNPRKGLIYQLYCYFYMCVSSLTFIPGLLTIYYYRHDVGRMFKAVTLLNVFTEMVSSVILCNLKRPKLKAIMGDINNFLTNCTPRDMKIVRKYVDLHKYFFRFIIWAFMMCEVFFTLMPVLIDEIQIPVDFWYPFSMDIPKNKGTVYFLQILIGAQTSLGVYTDLMVTYILWSGAIRLEILGNQFLDCETKEDYRNSIIKHQYLINFIRNIQRELKYVILKTFIFMTIAIVAGGFQLIHHEPFSVAAFFLSLIVASSLRIYVSTKPADDLKFRVSYFNSRGKRNITVKSINIISCIFYSKWYYQSYDVKLSLLNVAQRCQTPLVISVSGMMDELSLKQYAYKINTPGPCFSSNLLSYLLYKSFTRLREIKIAIKTKCHCNIQFLSTTIKYFMNIRVVFDE